MLAALFGALTAAIITASPPARAADTLTVRGIGSLRVGNAPPFSVPNSGCDSYNVPGRSGVSVLVRNGRVTVVAVRTATIATRSGVGVGQAADRVAAVYGASVSRQDDGYLYDPGPGADAALRMGFEIAGGRITVIRAGEGPDVLGGCLGGDRIRAAGSATATATAAGAPTTAAAPNTAPATTPDVTHATAIGPGRRVVVIDPGHNGANGSHAKEINRLVDAGGFRKACNTTGTTSLSGMTEATFNWAVARKLSAILQTDGWTVILTRQDNSGWGPCVDERGLTAGKVGAVALLSIHGDGGPTSGHGFHVIWPRPLANYTASTSASSLRLATSVRDALVQGGAAPSTYIGRQGLDGRTDLGTLNRSPVPSMMLEAGNLRNVGDDRELSSDAGQQRIAVAIAKGFTAWAASGTA